MDRKVDEAYISYVDRLSQSLADGSISYQEWSEGVLGETLYSDESLRRIHIFFTKFLDKLDKEEIKTLNGDRRVEEIRKAQDDLIRERKRLQTVNAELQETYRFQARNELFQEKIIDAIKNLEPLVPKQIKIDKSCHTNTGLLCCSDFHAGSTYEIKGLYGEIVNSYSFEIMKDRLWKLIGQIEADNIECDKMVVALLGDCFENILRLSSFAKLKEPVIDTVIKFSEFMSVWLVELQNRLGLPLEVIIVGGNHDTQAILGASKRLDDENLTKFVSAYLDIRLGACKDIKLNPFTDVAINTICKTNIAFTHGEEKDLKETLEYYSNLYNIDIDEIYAGHLHSPESKSIGIGDVGDRAVYRVGSIVGVDPFAKKIRKSARPSAYFAMYNDEEGHGWNKNYYL